MMCCVAYLHTVGREQRYQSDNSRHSAEPVTLAVCVCGGCLKCYEYVLC